jgi:hypothetical protein
MAYNPNLSYFMSRLQGVSTNYFRLEPQNSSVASANKIIRFALPSNCLLNTKSLAFMFNATVAGTTAGGRLPADISCLIDRVELSSGGIQIAQGFNGYGVFKKAKDGLCGEIPDPLNHPEVVRATSYVDGSAIATNANEVYSDANGQTQFCVKNWEGFLGSVAPSIIDTSLLSDCVLTLYLAGNEVLTSSNNVDTIANFKTDGNGNATWSMSNFHLVVETLGMADSVLDEMVARRISDVGYIEMPFKTFYSFSDTHNGNTRFSLSTQSLDFVWIIWRNNAYETQGAPVSVAGHKTVLGETGEYDEGVLGTDSEKYKGKFFNYVERPDGNAKPLYQLNFNGSFVPQFKATAEQMLEITKNSLPTLDEKKRNKPVMSLDQYKKNHFVQCVRLNLPESEEINQLSGVDTRGIALNAYLSTSGITANAGVMIVCEATSTARIGENRSMEIIS